MLLKNQTHTQSLGQRSVSEIGVGGGAYMDGGVPGPAPPAALHGLQTRPGLAAARRAEG